MPTEDSSEACSDKLYIACGDTNCCHESNARRRVFLLPYFWGKNTFLKEA